MVMDCRGTAYSTPNLSATFPWCHAGYVDRHTTNALYHSSHGGTQYLIIHQLHALLELLPRFNANKRLTRREALDFTTGEIVINCSVIGKQLC